MTDVPETPTDDPTDHYPDLDHERYVERTLELAREAAKRGDNPYGSLLVDPEAEDGPTVVAEARNTVVTDEDLRGHPELTLAARARSDLPAAVRERTIMYTSTEPCPMCAGGIAHSGLAAVVHSVSQEHAAQFAGRDDVLPSRVVYDRTGADTVSLGPVTPEAGIAVHHDHSE
ncbi:nucleoside deaminase [Halobaculum sp. MBLA0147]|uniref:nucleoside deaminase n=1 Tax=Halobaculum sp. MBLA0147 TaxID=3079934 RepID=UPI0035249705